MAKGKNKHVYAVRLGSHYRDDWRHIKDLNNLIYFLFSSSSYSHRTVHKHQYGKYA
jgi:hypothetical protein